MLGFGVAAGGSDLGLVLGGKASGAASAGLFSARTKGAAAWDWVVRSWGEEAHQLRFDPGNMNSGVMEAVSLIERQW